MTLRARLTATFLAVVLGPVLLGALLVGTTASDLGRERAGDRLIAAANAVRAEVGARCDRLATAATSAALLARDGRSLGPAVDGGLAATVQLVDVTGAVTAAAGPPAPGTWADCATGGSSIPAAFGGSSTPAAFGVRIERRDAAGTPLGYAVATAPVDDALLQALTAVAGVAVRTPGGGDAGTIRRTLPPSPGQPLRLVLGTDPAPLSDLYTLLLVVVTIAALATVCAAAWLARSTTRPLAELAHAAERFAAGDLDARVLVTGTDEVGRLGATFNRMTQQTRAHVRALRSSRDQLRGHLALLGHTLSGTHDLSRILHITLHTARAATSAQAGVVLMYDPATKMLVAQCAVGSLDLAGLRIKSGDGLLGSVADTGFAAHGRITADTELAVGEPTGGTYVAVPFAAPDPALLFGDESGERARGVLALYDRIGPDPFDETDVTTLTTFAAQAAVALDNVRLHEEAQRLSLTDPLTGLFNYRYLRESLRREVERAARFGRAVAVVALDLDHFKDVNDTYGHGAGDAVLAEIARRIRGITREVDFAFRRGGEEFVILLPETDAAGGAALARRLAAEIRRSPIRTRDHAIGVTVSIGVAVYPEHGFTGSAVLEAADLALYAAKAAGRDACRTAAEGPFDASPAPLTGASLGTQPSWRAHGG